MFIFSEKLITMLTQKFQKIFNPLIPKDIFKGKVWGAMRCGKLVFFVDGVGFSLAARSRDDIFIKKHKFGGINFWNPFSDLLSMKFRGKKSFL